MGVWEFIHRGVLVLGVRVERTQTVKFGFVSDFWVFGTRTPTRTIFCKFSGSDPVFGNVMARCRAANHHLFYSCDLEAITAMPTNGMAVIGQCSL